MSSNPLPRPQGLFWWLLVIGGIALVYVGVGPVFSDKPLRYSKALSDANQVGLAMRLYAEDHKGRLPKSLDDLAPVYLPDKTWFTHTHLVAPDAVLAELSPGSILLFRTDTDERGRLMGIAIVHADMSSELRKP